MEATAGYRERPTGLVLNMFGKYFIQWLLLIAVIILSMANSNFRQLANIENILLQSAFTGIGAAGMTLLIMTGAFDLSVAGLLGLCGVALALLVPLVGIVPSIIAVLVLGALLGVTNGLVVPKIRIPAFIATLGMMNIYLAVAFILTDAQVISVIEKQFRALGTGTMFGVLPIPFVVMIITYLIFAGILHFATYGRYIRAVGSNETAGRVAALPVDRVRIFAFGLVGLATALASVFLTALLSSANAIMATGYELNVIAVVVVGGTSLYGGRGTLFGSLTGALFFAVINNALNMFGVAAYWQYVAVGFILIVALGIEAVRRRLMGFDRE